MGNWKPKVGSKVQVNVGRGKFAGRIAKIDGVQAYVEATVQGKAKTYYRSLAKLSPPAATK